MDIAKSPIVLSGFGGLYEAAKSAAPLIRNMGTIGANLCQQVHCWHYRHPHRLRGRMICLRMGKRPCLALKGGSRYNAIMGTKVKIVGSDGTRTLSISDFYTPLGNALNRDQFLTEIAIPKPEQGCRQTLR